MDSPTPAPLRPATLTKTLTKLLRLRRATDGAAPDAAGRPRSPPVKRHMTHFPKSPSSTTDEGQELPSDLEAAESLLADLFASISAIKAAYAQLQLAQSPYDPDSIQSADLAVVAELRRIADLKRAHHRNRLPSRSPLLAQLHEQRSLLKTYEITAGKLDAELERTDVDLIAFRSALAELCETNRALEARLGPGRSLAAVDGLHLSGLSPTHFLAALRHVVRSIRSFTKTMLGHMVSAGWDVAAAAAALHPGVVLRVPSHTLFALESYVCARIFSDFHRRDFSLRTLEERGGWDRTTFFAEFTGATSATARQMLDGKQGWFAGFCRAKYLGLVGARMEEALLGDLEHRAAMGSGRSFPESEWFTGFAEMARRVWLLHCLFFSFRPEMGAAIFQVRAGCRFSEVYMNNVVEGERGALGWGPMEARPTVGFAVVPGFKVGKTVIQCMVYLCGVNQVNERT